MRCNWSKQQLAVLSMAPRLKSAQLVDQQKDA